MVAIMVHTPLYIHNITCRIGDYWFIAPVLTRLVIINTDTSVIATRATSAHLSGSYIRPCRNRLQD
jgi:hypothetical protein